MIKNEAEKAYRTAMKEAISGLIDEETGFATTQRKPFADGCHVFGALSEEWIEAQFHLKELEYFVEGFQTNCLSGDMPDETEVNAYLLDIREQCERAVMEIIQIAAVATKAKETLPDWINE